MFKNQKIIARNTEGEEGGRVLTSVQNAPLLLVCVLTKEEEVCLHYRVNFP